MLEQNITLSDVMKKALADADATYPGAAATNDELAGLPTRFPIQVNHETRVYLEYHAKALNTSIAGLAGLILNQVVANSIAKNNEKE